MASHAYPLAGACVLSHCSQPFSCVVAVLMGKDHTQQQLAHYWYPQERQHTRGPILLLFSEDLATLGRAAASGAYVVRP